MNEQRLAGSRNATTWTLAALVGVGLVASCGGGGGSTSSGPKTVAARQSTVLGQPVQVVERYIAYLADESTTTDVANAPALSFFNSDLDNIDLVAHITDMATKATTNIGVATDDFALVRTVASGTHLFMVVDETKDEVDWDGMNGFDVVVLLHYNVSLKTGPTYVATLDTTGATKLVTVDDRVYFADVPAAPVNGDTTISFVDTVAPTVPVRVLHPDTTRVHTAQLLGQDEGLIFLYQDEVVEGVDLNGDVDTTDGFVLALLDGTAPGASMRTVGLAMRDAMIPFRALNRAANDWLVAFLVNENDQGAFNFNDPAIPEFAGGWQPLQCVGFEDADMLDDVLHYLEYAAWIADPVTDPPINTGLVGSDRVLALDTGTGEYVATISAEADEGTCDLNGDTFVDDDILRWVKVDSVVRPYIKVEELVAIERTAGGVEGVSDFDGVLLCVVDEADDGRNHDDDLGLDRTLVAWLDPADGNAAFWEFDHCKAVPQCPGIESVGTQWMGERMERDRFLVAFQESVFGVSINDPFFRSKGGDNDTLDSVPTFGLFGGSPTELNFPGPRIAVDDDNAGIVIVEGRAFYRVDEAADNTDWNKDNDKNDMVLFRTTVSTVSNSFFLGTLNTQLAPAIAGGSEIGVAFVSDESADLRDLNKDGDTNDFVLQWVRL